MPFHGHAGFVHRATLWPRVGTDRNGRPVVSNSPVGIDCRWDFTRRSVMGTEGVPVSVDATVSVDREIPVGSAMWKGDPNDLPGTGRTPEIDVYEVVTYEQDDDWRGADTYREVTLARTGNSLPTQGAEVG